MYNFNRLVLTLKYKCTYWYLHLIDLSMLHDANKLLLCAYFVLAVYFIRISS